MSFSDKLNRTFTLRDAVEYLSTDLGFKISYPTLHKAAKAGHLFTTFLGKRKVYQGIELMRFTRFGNYDEDTAADQLDLIRREIAKKEQE